MALRWGIVHVGNSANDFCCAVRTLSDLDHELVAVADEDLDNAEQFAQTHGFRQAHGNCTELAENPNVEVVYITTDRPNRAEIAYQLLEKGKHVIFEKPLYTIGMESKKLIMYAERKKRFFMEGLAPRFFPSYEFIRRFTQSDGLGDIQMVTVTAGSNNLGIVDTESSEKVLTLTALSIQFLVWIFELPPTLTKVKALMDEDGINVGLDAEFSYGKDIAAKISITTQQTSNNSATIVGTKGQITLENFVLPTYILDIDSYEKIWPLPRYGSELPFCHPHQIGLCYEADEVRRCIRAKLIQSDFCKHNDSLIILQTMDKIQKELCNI